jgi:hypothetical protein
MSCSSTPSPYLLHPFTPSSLHPVMRRGRRLAVCRHRGRAATRRASAAAHQEGKHHRGARPPGAGGKRHLRSCCQWSTTTTPPDGDFFIFWVVNLICMHVIDSWFALILCNAFVVSNLFLLSCLLPAIAHWCSPCWQQRVVLAVLTRHG